MGKKINVFLLCMIFLLVSSSLMFQMVDCRAVRSKQLKEINGQDQTTVAAIKVKKSWSSGRPLMRSYGFGLASGPSREGAGH
ncbi:unnamed protein product [Eruca vesicaria subsp. sativa]|uniref:Transmembrane protein n=1 Tax=Eruca vesicaria subsp. sativa TaxID=29727 RepID=A0ABC8M4L8_ERUVS|nr:unnamed protein product [Eruca vesicaria subsp. sativa]